MPKLLSHKSSAIKKRKVRKNQERSQNRNANRKKRLSKRGVRKYTSNGKPQIRQNDIRKDICPISFAHRLPHIAKTTKFVKRNVGFSVRNFLLAVIEHVAHDNIESIDVIRQSYCQKINDSIGAKSFWNRLSSDECVDFFRETLGAVEEIHNKTASMYYYKEGVELINLLNSCGLNIKDVLIWDGTYWKLNDALSEQYPGTRTNKKEKILTNVYDEYGKECSEDVKSAGIGLQTQMSLKTGSIKSLVLTPEVANEKNYVLIDKSVRALYLIDSGYYSHTLIENIINNNSLFLTKGRKNCAAEILECKFWTSSRKTNVMEKDYVGLKVSDALVLALENKQNLDLITKLANGIKVRMVAFRAKDSKTKEFKMVLLVTNIDSVQLSPKNISNLYRVRWQCELLFKNLKSGENLTFSHISKNINIITTFIIASLITYFLKNIPALFLSQLLKDVSFWKIHVKSTWFTEYLDAYINGKIETIRKILLFLYKNQCFAVKDRQSKSKILEFKTLRSVLDDMHQSLTESVVQGNKMIA